MKWTLSILTGLFLIAVMFVATVSCRPTNIAQAPMSSLPIVQIEPVSQYVAKVKLNNGMRVRLLVLKHCFERVALDEERDMIEVVNLAKQRGLDIQDMEGHFVDKNGKINRNYKCNLSQLKNFLVQQMKLGAEPGDTIIIYTTGHGSKGGWLAQFDKRSVVMQAFADAAEEADQEVLWWQSSCYAAAGLLPMSDLNETQQELLSMVTSSDAHHTSYWGDQTEPMKRVLIALAEGSSELDKDEDGVIIAQELKEFLAKVKKSNLVFAARPDEPIFGSDWANKIPINDHDGGFKPRDKYIPKPLIPRNAI